MKFVNNDAGVTLIEVLASMVILSIILFSVMNFFPQIGMMNQQNGEKAQAVNTAKQILVYWQGRDDVKNFLQNPTTTAPPLPIAKEDSDYYYFNTTDGNFVENIQIKKTSDIDTNPAKAYFIQVQLLNNKGTVVTENYGYIIVE